MKKIHKSLLGIVVALCIVAYLTFKLAPEPEVSAITRDGVVTEIQKLNQLHSVAFSVDTVVTAQKQGTWQKLWQDEQKALFVAKGRVLAGVDLSKIRAEDVVVAYNKPADKRMPPIAHITITLPPTQVFEVFLDDVQMYDWRTGLFGIVKNDPKILDQVQQQGKIEVLTKACQGDIMTMAANNASEHIKALFSLTGATVVVQSSVGSCAMSG